MSLRLEHDGPIARLLIDRADKRNAFTLAMWQALPRLLEQAAALPDLRLLLVQAAHPGGAFCAGADIPELLANSHDAEWLAANQAAINKAQHDLARFPLPTIAWVEGDAVGGGCGMALACDLRIATPSARFGITPSKLGIVYPLHDVKLLIDLVGPGQAKRMLFSGQLLDADEAQRRVHVLRRTPAGQCHDEAPHPDVGCERHDEGVDLRLDDDVTRQRSHQRSGSNTEE